MYSLLRRLLGQSRPETTLPLVSSTGRLMLTPLDDTHYPLLVDWFKDPESCRLAFGVDTDPETLAAMTTDYLAELQGDKSGVLLISLQVDDRATTPLGFLRYKLFRQGRNSLARVGILLGAAEHRGQGLGSEAMSTLISYLFERRNVQTVELDTAHFNSVAQRSFLKCGFQKVRETEVIGLHNRWTERRIIMRLTLQQWQAHHQQLRETSLNSQQSLNGRL